VSVSLQVKHSGGRELSLQASVEVFVLIFISYPGKMLSDWQHCGGEMGIITRFIRLSLLGTGLSVSTAISACAHGLAPIPIPLRHSVIPIPKGINLPLFKTDRSSRSTSAALLALLSKNKQDKNLLLSGFAANYGFQNPALAGKSLGFRAVQNFYNQLVRSGIALGQTSSGQILNGGLVGTYYIYVGPPSNLYMQANPSNALFVALGNNNPLNTHSLDGLYPFTLPSASSNSINFGTASAGNKGVGDPGFIPPISGALRALFNQEKLIILKSVALGKAMAPGGSVVGGEFSGTGYYLNANGSYSPYGFGKFVFAFGNNPLNHLSGVTDVTINPTNYLQFSNGVTKNIVGGQLFDTQYDGMVRFAEGDFLGNSPLNNFPNSTTFFPTNLTNYLEF
jgi:hypothetical protein